MLDHRPTPDAIANPPQGAVVPLVERLKSCAALWCEATGRTRGALATIVANHGSFFERLDAPDAGTTTATLEKFARFLVEPDNWPAGAVPDEVCRFAHAVGISGGACGVSPDIAGEIIAPESTRSELQSEGAGPAQVAGASGRTPVLAAGAFAAPEPGKGLPASAGSGVADEYWPEAPE